MSINAKQSLTGQINNPSALSGDVSIGTTYISAGEGTGTPIVISATKIEGGYEISLTDSYDTETIQIMDGKDGVPGQPGPKGDPGEPGVSGVYYGSGEAPEECMVQVDPDGGSINLIEAPLTAEVGQILSVKSVDENGKPTEWEVVDMASGGSGSNSDYILINNITLENDVERVEISKDDNGNEFSLSDVVIAIDNPPADSEDCYIVVTGEKGATTQRALPKLANTTQTKGVIELLVVGDLLRFSSFASTDNHWNSSYITSLHNVEMCYTGKIKHIRIRTSGRTNFKTGMTIKVFGR